MAELARIIDYCNLRLDSTGFEDYCPNGLQVEACNQVDRIVSGVTASLALIEAAKQRQADLLLVHHGYFWKNEPQPLIGMKGRRIQALYAAGMSLAAYHLPLDVHRELGNNAQLARRLNLPRPESVTDDGLLWGCEFPDPLPVEEIVSRLQSLTGRAPLHLPGGEERIRRLAWCTGGAQSWLDKAADRGFDAFITGEVSESTFHIAAERKIHFIAAGHHVTERYGVQALGNELADKFNVKHDFIDIFNPV